MPRDGRVAKYDPPTPRDGPAACIGGGNWGTVTCVRATRPCSRVGCSAAAVATLTYVYSDSTAVLGPLATTAEPHTYDLCTQHAERLTVPRGWDVVRLATEFEPAPPSSDDLLALADAVREASRVPAPKAGPIDAGRGKLRFEESERPHGSGTRPPPVGVRGHLSVIRTDEDT